jgi:hypothetical protein
MVRASSSSDVTADVGPLSQIPHALFIHVFPGLPLPVIMKLSRSSRDCRHAAQAAIPMKQDALVASVSTGCRFFSPEQLGKGKEYYIQRPATRAEEDGSTMKNPYLAN